MLNLNNKKDKGNTMMHKPTVTLGQILCVNVCK